MLDDNSKFGVKALTEAINRLDATPTPIRDLALFETRSLSTTYVDIENQDGQLKLVQSQQRGTSGEALPEKTRSIRSFKIPHLPINDVIFADDVQNIRAFGSTQAETVMQKVNEKLAEGKLALEMTREHLQLGALNGKILDADGSELYDIYKEFGLTRKKHVWALDNAQTEVGALIDKTLMAQRKLLKGAMPMGWLALCGMTFLEKLKYHPTIKPLYERYRDGALYREGGINQVEFEHNGIKFVAYTTDFGTRHAKIEENQAILLPTGKNDFSEASDYLKDIEIKREFYKTLLVLDPPYVRTKQGNYRHAPYFGMVAFLNLMRFVRPPFVFFSSTKSEFLDYVDWVIQHQHHGWQNLIGYEKQSIMAYVNATYGYEDHLVYRF